MNKERCVALWAVGLAVCLLALQAVGAESRKMEMTLADCVWQALANNLDFQMERISHRETQRGVSIAKGGYDPVLALSGARSGSESGGESAGIAAGALETLNTKTDREAWSAGISGVTPFFGLQYDIGADFADSWGRRNDEDFDTTTGFAGVTLTQPLLKGFRMDGTRYAVRVAEKQSAEALLQLEEQLQQTLLAIENAWYDLIAARDAILVQEEALRLATQLYEDNKNKVLVGALAPLDEQQAASQAASARATLAGTRQAYNVAQNELKALVFANQRAMAGVELLPPASPLQAEEVPVDAAASGEQALARRPDLRKARLALERQGLLVDYNRNKMLPSLDLVGAYGLSASDETSYGDAWDRIRDAEEPEWRVGLALSIPLGNRAARGTYAQSQDAEARQRLQLALLEEQALVEVDNAASAVRSGWEAVEATTLARVYAEEALKAEQQKFEHGQSTSFVVLQLQKELTNARNSEIQALTGYYRQQARLARADGSLFDRLGIDFHDAVLSSE